MTDIEKLRLLLPHWIEHNAEHASEFRAWIERIRATQNADLVEHLEAAIQKMDSVNHDLQIALQHLGGSESAMLHDHTHAY